MGSALLGDTAVVGWLVTGLPNPRVEPEVTDELLRRGEPIYVADGCQDAHRDCDVHTRDCHQTLDPRLRERLLREALVHIREFSTKAIELTGMAKDDAALILGKRLSLQPGPAALREQGSFVRRDQVGMQNGLDPVLQTGHLGDKLRSFGHHAATYLGLFVRHPHFG
jgi:hypothetical protein